METSTITRLGIKETFKASWHTFRRCWKVQLINALLYMAIYIGLELVLRTLIPVTELKQSTHTMSFGITAFITIFLLLKVIFISYPLMLGLLKAPIAAARGEKARISMLFSCFKLPYFLRSLTLLFWGFAIAIVFGVPPMLLFFSKYIDFWLTIVIYGIILYSATMVLSLTLPLIADTVMGTSRALWLALKGCAKNWYKIIVLHIGFLLAFLLPGLLLTFLAILVKNSALTIGLQILFWSILGIIALGGLLLVMCYVQALYATIYTKIFANQAKAELI